MSKYVCDDCGELDEVVWEGAGKCPNCGKEALEMTPKPEPEAIGWQTAETRCIHCGYVYVTVVPLATPLEECPKCGMFSPTPEWQEDAYAE